MEEIRGVKPCIFFLKSRCNRGSECAFSHSTVRNKKDYRRKKGRWGSKKVAQRRVRPGDLGLPTDVWGIIASFLPDHRSIMAITSTCRMAKTLLVNFKLQGRLVANRGIAKFLAARGIRRSENFTLTNVSTSLIDFVCTVEDSDGNELICVVDYLKVVVFDMETCDKVFQFFMFPRGVSRDVNFVMPLSHGRVACAHSVSSKVSVSVFYVSKDYKRLKKAGQRAKPQRWKFEQGSKICKNGHWTSGLCILEGTCCYANHVFCSSGDCNIRIFDVESNIHKSQQVHKIDFRIHAVNIHKILSLGENKLAVACDNDDEDPPFFIIYHVERAQCIHSIICDSWDPYNILSCIFCALRGGGLAYQEEYESDVFIYMPGNDPNAARTNSLESPMLDTDNEVVNSICQLKDGRICVGTADSSILVYEVGMTNFREAKEDDAFPYDRCLEVHYEEEVISVTVRRNGDSLVSIGEHGSVCVTAMNAEDTLEADDGEPYYDYSDEEDSSTIYDYSSNEHYDSDYSFYSGEIGSEIYDY